LPIYTWMASRSLKSIADETTIAFPGATPQEQASKSVTGLRVSP
jgi:hypothetical protein